jgi:hypothetical protein
MITRNSISTRFKKSSKKDPDQNNLHREMDGQEQILVKLPICPAAFKDNQLDWLTHTHTCPPKIQAGFATISLVSSTLPPP